MTRGERKRERAIISYRSFNFTRIRFIISSVFYCTPEDLYSRSRARSFHENRMRVSILQDAIDSLAPRMSLGAVHFLGGWHVSRSIFHCYNHRRGLQPGEPCATFSPWNVLLKRILRVIDTRLLKTVSYVSRTLDIFLKPRDVTPPPPHLRFPCV